MGVFSNKVKNKIAQPSRKQQRKDKRKQKKLRKSDFFSKKRIPGQFVLNPDRSECSSNNADGSDEEQCNVEKYNLNTIKKSHSNKSSKVLIFHAIYVLNLII